MRPPDVALRPKSRIFVERRGTQKDVWRFAAGCNEVTAADRTKESSLARRRFIGGQLVLTAKPPKILPRDAPGCSKCRGVRFSTGYAMTVPERVETRNFVRYGSAMTAALHLGFPILRRLSDEAKRRRANGAVAIRAFTSTLRAIAKARSPSRYLPSWMGQKLLRMPQDAVPRAYCPNAGGS